jgi:septal ring factor EnvC (AmiA/AmiB activator)
LRHTKFSPKELELDNNVPTDVVSGYQFLLRASHDEISLDSPELCVGFKILNDRLKAFSQAFSYANALEDERASIYKILAERDRQIVNLNQSLAEQEGKIADLNQSIAERDMQISSLNQSIAERDMQISSLNQSVTDLDRQLNDIYKASLGY